MKNIYLLILLLISLPFTSYARYHHRHHKRDTGLPYIISNKILLKWVPTALAPTAGASLRFGGEYCFLKNFGADIDIGYVLHSSNKASQYALFGGNGGYLLAPEIKLYVINGSKARMSAGVNCFYRHQEFSNTDGSFVNNQTVYEYKQTGARENVYGLAAEIGVLGCIHKNFHLEAVGGIGAKEINFQRDNFTSTTTFQNFEGLWLSEYDIQNKGTLLYLFIHVKICWMLGKAIAK